MFAVPEGLIAPEAQRALVSQVADALDLTCAKDGGFRVIHSSDKRLTAAAQHFGIKTKNAIG